MQSNSKEGLNPAAQHLSAEALAKEEPQHIAHGGATLLSPSNPSTARESSARPTLIRRSLSEGGTPNIFTLLTLIATIFLVVSCKEKAAQPTSITQIHTSSETSLTLSLSATTLPTSGMLTATLSAEHPQSTHIHFPSTSTDFGDFTVFESTDTPPALNTAGKITTSRTYTLEPDLPGTSTFPSLTTVVLSDGSISTEILTDPVSIVVTSVLTTSETKPYDIVTDPNQNHLQAYSFRIPFPFVLITIILALIATYAIAKHRSKSDPPVIIGEDEFSQLELSTAEKILTHVESAFTRRFADTHNLSLRTYDFQGLLAALDNPSQTFLATIDQFERFQYSQTPPSERDVWKIYHFLAHILEEEAP